MLCGKLKKGITWISTLFCLPLPLFPCQHHINLVKIGHPIAFQAHLRNRYQLFWMMPAWLDRIYTFCSSFQQKQTLMLQQIQGNIAHGRMRAGALAEAKRNSEVPVCCTSCFSKVFLRIWNWTALCSLRFCLEISTIYFLLDILRY